MRITAACVALALLGAPGASGRPLSFGEPVPLTNTRYGAVQTRTRLVSNGSDVLRISGAFVTNYVPGQRRIGQRVFAWPATIAAVVWTGSHFLALGNTDGGGGGAKNKLLGRLISRSGDLLGESFVIADGAVVQSAAANGESIVLLCAVNRVLIALPLGPNGRQTGPPSSLFEGWWNSADVCARGDGFAAAIATDNDVTILSLHRSGREQSRSLAMSSPDYARIGLRATVAAIGDKAIAVWEKPGSDSLEAVRFGADAAVEARLLIFSPPQWPQSLLAIGDRWLLAHRSFTGLQITWIDRDLRIVETEEVMKHGDDYAVAAVNGRPFVTWTDRTSHRPFWGPLGGPAQMVGFEAAHQHLVTAASSDDSTLIVWSEGRLRAGVLSREGWSEAEIDGVTLGARAASDGHEFIVIARSGGYAGVATFIGSDGVPRSTTPLPMSPKDVAWNGSQYLIIGDRADGPAVMRLSPNGVAQLPVRLNAELGGAAAIATDGSTTAVALLRDMGCTVLCISITGPASVVRLDPNLQPIDEEPAFTTWTTDVFRLAFDGTQFRAVWKDSGTATATIDARTGRARTGPVMLRPFDDLAAGDGALFITWRDANATGVFVFGPNQERTSESSFQPDDASFAAVAFRPNGAPALFTSERIGEAPHYSARRVMMRVSGAANAPDAPHLDAILDRGRVALFWTVVPQKIRGYRIEFRIGNAPWEELEPLFPAVPLGAFFNGPLLAGARYEFRMRAIGEGTMSAYSNTAEVTAH
ncbi:MAG: fibronectin type III domain-containing protein [Acidobacteriota bacterium]|nr:fibronectin type III domain-containing protein [Acidobacteriota bacterium]